MLIERPKYLEKLIKYKDKDLIKVVTGVRRCGKSVLLFDIYSDYLIRTGVDAENIIKINLEHNSNAALRDSDAIYSFVSEKIKKNSRKHYVMIDEIQYVKDFEDLYSIMCGYTFREDRDSGRMLAEAAGSGVFSEYRQVLLIMQKWSSQNEEYVKQGNIGRVPCQILLIGKETDPLIGNSENDPNACSIIRIDNEDPLEDVL